MLITLGHWRRLERITRRSTGVLLAVVLLAASPALAQEDPFTAKDPKPGDISEHPYGATPLARMLTLAHTNALPKCDKIIVYALEARDPSEASKPKLIPDNKAFPIRPYKTKARVLGTKALSGRDAAELVDTWRAMTFDKFAGAFCHLPVYGLRFYRGDKLLFETSVCWKCSNFYLPDVEPAESDLNGLDGDTSYQWYGFKNNPQAKKLLTQIRGHLEHPALEDKE